MADILEIIRNLDFVRAGLCSSFPTESLTYLPHFQLIN